MYAHTMRAHAHFEMDPKEGHVTTVLSVGPSANHWGDGMKGAYALAGTGPVEGKRGPRLSGTGPKAVMRR